MNRFIRTLLLGLFAPFVLIIIFSCSDISKTPTPSVSVNSNIPDTIPVYTYKIVNIYPHARNAFTQGLAYENGILYEGTGLFGQSTVRKVDIETGYVKKYRWLPSNLFGEGLTVFGDKIIQLTWKSGTGFVYDKDSLDLLKEFNYPTEGWGITHDGKNLIMSDGSSMLFILDPDTFERTGSIEAFDEKGPVKGLNELEYVKGEIYANVWPTNRIAIINPKTGQVTGWIVIENILDERDREYPVDVLNGIAYNPENNRLFVTGKLWPKLFEIELVSLP
ncbi:glutaminyl-peptide cyclotransferase [bacterium]|nr:glutaminyl-peptide cyclotransferase [bacterium]